MTAPSPSRPEASIPSREEDPDEAVAAAQMERDVWRDIEARRTTPSNGDWIEWSGGECPVAPQAIIETQMRHETPQRYDPDQCEAGSYIWSHDGGAWDIVAYRIIRP